MAQISPASVCRWPAGAFFFASFSYCLNSAETCRWSSVRRSIASAVFIVRGAVFSVVFSPLGGWGAQRTAVFAARGLRAAGAAVARALALGRPVFFAGAAGVASPAALAFLRA